jgi:DNA-binding CsgD family transcriptional regulator
MDMDPLDLTQSFVERCERSAPVAELTVAFQSAIEHLGFRHFACCSHVNPGRPPPNAVVIHNYPTDWVRSYAARNLHQRDPVFQHAERELLPFRWETPGFRAGLTSSQTRLLHEAADIGIAHGYTVPIHLPWTAGALRASCSVIPDSRFIDERAYRAVQVMAIYLYASAEPGRISGPRNRERRTGPMLSARERECLELAAEGKSDWDISQLLRISEHTVHKHVEAAKHRLGVSTRTQAIVWAVQHREICFGGVVSPGETGKQSASTQESMRPKILVKRSGMQPGQCSDANCDGENSS